MDKDYAFDYSERGVRFILDNYRELRESFDALRLPLQTYVLDLDAAVKKSKITERQREVLYYRYMEPNDEEDLVVYTATKLDVSPRTVQYDSTKAINELYIYLNGVR